MNNSYNKIDIQLGFTLIELLIVAAVIGVLSSIAIPSYQDFTIRSRLTEGLHLAHGAKKAIEINGSATQLDLDITVNSWNVQANNMGATSKFVTSVLFTPPPNSTGVITITYNPITSGVGAGQNTLILAPFVRTANAGNQLTLSAALALGATGPIDWGCASNSNTFASSHGMPAPLGSVRNRFVPAQCR